VRRWLFDFFVNYEQIAMRRSFCQRKHVNFSASRIHAGRICQPPLFMHQMAWLRPKLIVLPKSIQNQKLE